MSKPKLVFEFNNEEVRAAAKTVFNRLANNGMLISNDMNGFTGTITVSDTQVLDELESRALHTLAAPSKPLGPVSRVMELDREGNKKAKVSFDWLPLKGG